MAAKPPAREPEPATAARGKVAARELSDRLADPKFQADIEKAVRELPPDRAAELVAMLEASIKRRKLELWGYIAAAAIVLFGMVGTLLIMGSAGEGSFVAWIFLIPLAVAGLVMTWVGKRAKAVGKLGKAPAPGKPPGKPPGGPT